jgi:RHS repeat-associated protein
MVYQYDHLDRRNFLGFGETSPGVYESTITYGYDIADRLLTAADSASGTITLDYNNIDRLVSQVTSQGSIAYTYDKVGRQKTMTVAGQPVVNYDYDDGNRLKQITQGSASVRFTYDDGDRLTSKTLPNGIATEYSYDSASRPKGIVYRLGSTVLGDLTYEYDQIGRRNKVGGTFARVNLPQALTVTTHDDANRLTQREAATLTYDNNGNLTNDGVNTYTWNARNELTSISGTGLNAAFTYDAFGRRSSKTINGSTTEFLYDDFDVVQEKVSGIPSANMLMGGLDQTVTRTDAGGSFHFLTDALGSTLSLTDQTGTEVTQYTYEPFGQTSVSGSANGNTSQYTGRENDGTGLHYYRARYYSPTLQRFISEDPIGFAGGNFNLYSYVGNSPVDFSDPGGTQRADRDRPGDKEWADGMRKQMAEWDSKPTSGRKDASQCDSGAGASPFIIAGGIAMSDGPEPFVMDAVAVIFLIAALAAAPKAPVVDTRGRVLEFPTGDVLQRGKKTYKIPPPPPQPPDRNMRCSSAAMKCSVIFANDPEKIKLCQKSFETCVNTNLPTIFPHGEWVP